MIHDDEIEALLAKAEPLRELPDDEPAKIPLTAIVDRINALRAEQAKTLLTMPRTPVEGEDADPEAEAIKAELALQPPALPKARLGRPRKAEAN